MSVEDIWADDLLGRREDARTLIDFLVRRHAERSAAGSRGAYVVNLNAGWGYGKTFFIERLEKQLSAEGHLTASVNAWRDDSSKEPVIAVMAAIEKSLEPHFAGRKALAAIWGTAKSQSAKIVASLIKGAGRQLLRRYTGEAINDISELLDERGIDLPAMDADAPASATAAISAPIETLLTNYIDSKIADYEERIQSTLEFQNRMHALLEELDKDRKVKLPFFILIDELDRCRPTYAIEMLEQVKHLFDLENTVFIIATDGDQLSHSVRAVYGEGFDGKRYLLRFFHRHYRFEDRDMRAFVNYLFVSNEIDPSKLQTPFNAEPADIFNAAMVRYRLTLRDAEQCFDILRSTLTVWDLAVPAQLTVLLPLIVYYQQHNMLAMSEFVKSNGAATPGEHGEWSVETMSIGANFRDRKRVSVSIDDINKALLSQAKKPLRDIYSYNPASPTASYVHDVLSSEFQRVHGNRSNGDSPVSIINDYPAIVRRVGRLAPPADDTGEAA